MRTAFETAIGWPRAGRCPPAAHIDESIPRTWRSPLAGCGLAGRLLEERARKVREAIVKANCNRYAHKSCLILLLGGLQAACDATVATDPGALEVGDEPGDLPAEDADIEVRSEELRSRLPDAFDLPDTEAITWMDAIMKVVATDNIGAPEASRLYGAVSVALYESTVRGMPGARSLGGQLNGLPRLKSPGCRHRRLDWPSVMARATGLLAADLLSARPRALATVTALMNERLEARAVAGVREKDRRHSVHYGERIGKQLIEWMRSDGFLANRDRAYTAPVGPQYWQPTGGAAATTRPSEPYFGQNRPQAMARAGSCLPEAPPAYSEQPGSLLHKEALQVLTTGLGLTAEQSFIARYWADGNGTAGTPGHWMAIARQMVAGSSLARTVEVFASVGITQSDAFVSCWNAKYHFAHLRPETYIRRVIDPAWTPLLPTPQHPQHTSGHACSAGAAAEVLTVLFGSRSFSDQTHAATTLGARTFDSFRAAAQEAATSRLYTGHHFPSGSEAGLGQGKCAARSFFKRVSLWPTYHRGED
jgi:hypothetical protein